MKHLSSPKTGFTIVEIALFLALSGFLMVGLIMGANVSISRQRYSDSVNSFAEFVRGTYSDVLNVSNDKNPDNPTDNAGRTTTAVYGKIISIGENSGNDTVYVYDLVGNAVNSSSIKSSRIIDMMYEESINANIFDKSHCPNPVGCNNAFYRMNSYDIPWSGNLSRPKTNDVDNGTGNSENGKPFHGAIIIVRSPVTGNTRTYAFDYDEKAIKNALSTAHISTDFHNQLTNSNASANFSNFLKTLAGLLTKTNLSPMPKNGHNNDLTICIDSDDNNGGNRRGIKIAAGATNSSGVMLTEMDAVGASCEGRHK